MNHATALLSPCARWAPKNHPGPSALAIGPHRSESD